MTGWGLIGSQEDIEIQEAGSTIRANGPDDGTLAGKDIVYWRAPGNYLGKRVSGRTLFKIVYRVSTENQYDSIGKNCY